MTGLEVCKKLRESSSVPVLFLTARDGEVDRILGLDTISILAVGVVGVFAVRTGLSLYVDIALGVALVSFVSTVAFARYLLSRRPQ